MRHTPEEETVNELAILHDHLLVQIFTTWGRRVEFHRPEQSNLRRGRTTRKLLLDRVRPLSDRIRSVPLPHEHCLLNCQDVDRRTRHFTLLVVGKGDRHTTCCGNRAVISAIMKNARGEPNPASKYATEGESRPFVAFTIRHR